MAVVLPFLYRRDSPHGDRVTQRAGTAFPRVVVETRRVRWASARCPPRRPRRQAGAPHVVSRW